MKNNLSQKATKMICASIVLVAALMVLVPKTYAHDAPRIYVKELNINQTSFNAGEVIKGDFLMWNTSTGIAADLSYAVSLDQGYTSFNKETHPVSGQIAPGKTLIQTFSYTIPKNFNSGTYSLKVQVYLQSGMALNWGKKDIEIKGPNGYLNIAGSYVMQGEKAFDPTVGPSFNAGESVKIKFNVYNPATQKIDFKPQVSIYSFQDNTKQLESFSGSAYSLNPKESKDVEIEMPKYQNPGSYLAKVILLSQNDPVSNDVNFRWVVAGAGARILNVTVKSNILEAGKAIEASVNYTGPADNSDVGEAKLAIKLYNAENGQIVASGEKTIEVGRNAATIAFILIPSSSADSFTAEAKITKDGKELASYSANIKNPSDKIKEGSVKNNFGTAGIIIVVVLVILIFILFIAKKMLKGKKLFTLLIFACAGFLIAGAGDVRAASTCAEGDGCVLGCTPTADPDCSTLDFTWNSPILDSVYVPGDPIIYEGENTNISCYNNVSMLKADSFICDVNKAGCIKNGSEKKYVAESSKMTFNPDDGKLYVLDSEDGNARIIRIDPATKIQETVLSGEGTAAGRLHKPEGIFYSSPYFYIADTGNNRVARVKTIDLDTPANWQIWTTSISGANFNAPWGIVFQSPYMYVTDSGNNRIVRYNFGSSVWDNQYNGLAALGTALGNPSGISTDGVYIYAADTGNNRIVRFKPNDSGWQAFSTDGSATFTAPRDVYYSSPNLYVMDTGNFRVVMFDPESAGAWTTFGGVYGSGVGQFGLARGIFVWDSRIYVGDGWNFKRMVRFEAWNMAGTWDVFDFSPKSYNISAYVPLSVGSPLFAKGDGGVAPVGAVYSKIQSHVEYVIGATDDANSFERVIINTAPIGSCPAVANPVDADGNVYNTVKIGTQCWMRQNMRVGTMIPLCSGGFTGGACSSSPAPAQTLNNQSIVSGIQKWCYGDDPYNCNSDGAIYQWAEAMNLPTSCNTNSGCTINSPHQGICPAGWHIPTDNEQAILEQELTDAGNTCRANREDVGANVPWDDCSAAGTKLKFGGTSGFEGILNGWTTSTSYSYPFNDSRFENIDWVAGYWSATQNPADAANQVWHRHLFNAFSNPPPGSKVMRHSGPKTLGDGVRCIYDGPVAPIGSAPTLNVLGQVPIDYCEKDLPAAVSVRWEFNDAEDGYGVQTAYEIQLARNDGAVCNPGKKGSPAFPNITNQLLGTQINAFCPGFIAYGGYTYTWRVRVYDSNDNVNTGDFKSGDAFPYNISDPNNPIPTPTHSYPIAKFTYSPTTGILAFQNVTFDPSLSTAAPGYTINRFDWNFDSNLNSSTDASSPTPPPPGYTALHPFAAEGTYVVDLQVTDSSGFQCWASDRNNQLTIGVASNDPQWNETTP